MLRVTVAHSEDPATPAAASDLVTQIDAATAGSPDGNPAAALLFAGVGHDHDELLSQLRERWPGLPIVGCSTDGEAASPRGFQEDSVVLTLIHVAEPVRLSSGVARDLSQGPFASVRGALEAAILQMGQEPRLALVFPDSLTTSGAALVRAMKDTLGPGCVLVGATAGDQRRFERTYQFFGDDVLSDACPFVLIGGPVRVGTGVASGWRPIGRNHVVTESDGHVVVSVDGARALDFYRSYLGHGRNPMGEYALAVEAPDGSTYLRAPLSWDEATGAVNFAGDVPQGARVQLTDFDRAAVVAAARDSVSLARDGFAGTPSAALFFSCAGRRTVLGSRSADEFAELRAVLGEMPVSGFYGYGEIGPPATGLESGFHNETFVTLLLGMDDG